MRIRFNKHKFQTQKLNDLYRGNECEVGCYHFIARLEPERHHGYLQGVSAVGTGNDMAHSQVTLQLFLEEPYVRPFYEGS